MKTQTKENEITEFRFLTVQEAADLLRVNHKTLRDAIARGDLKAVRIGKVFRISKAVLDRWVGGK